MRVLRIGRGRAAGAARFVSPSSRRIAEPLAPRSRPHTRLDEAPLLVAHRDRDEHIALFTAIALPPVAPAVRAAEASICPFL